MNRVDVVERSFLGYNLLFLCFRGRFFCVIFKLLVVFLCVKVIRFRCYSSGCFLIRLELVDEFYLFSSGVFVLNFLESV